MLRNSIAIIYSRVDRPISTLLKTDKQILVVPSSVQGTLHPHHDKNPWELPCRDCHQPLWLALFCIYRQSNA